MVDVIKNQEPILITGVAGFIGFHFAQRLLTAGYTIIGIDNINEYYDIGLKYQRLHILQQDAKFIFHKTDINDYEALKKIFYYYQPKLITHLAAQAGVRYSIESPRVYIYSNVVGFFNILECCRHFKSRHLVFASSSSVYGNQNHIPFSIASRTDAPVSLYAATKKTNELMAYTYSHLYDIPSTGVRFFTVYGSYGRPDMAYFKFARNIMEGKPIEIYNNGDMWRDFTYIDDAVDALEKILFRPPCGRNVNHVVYNVGNSHPEKIERLVELLEDYLGRKAEKVYSAMQPGDVLQTYADITPLIDDFGIYPHITLEDGIKQFTKWYIKYFHENCT